MKQKTRETIIFFFVGFILGAMIVFFSRNELLQMAKKAKDFNFREAVKRTYGDLKQRTRIRREVTEDFSRPVKAVAGKSFGKENQLTFELFRNGTFVIDGQSGYAWQKSDSYRDSAIIRSTKPLPKTYKISIVVGDIDYGLEKISGLPPDPEYTEGPKNENGCYLLAITDRPPTGHHTNAWWHQHRKVVIDVDNNVWGHGMPNPIFMVYFDRENKLVSYNGQNNRWQNEWMKGLTYDSGQWYKIEIEKTKKQYIMSVRSESGRLLKSAAVDRSAVWMADDAYEDYFVVGEPHENYYQGSMKIKEITISY